MDLNKNDKSTGCKKNVILEVKNDNKLEIYESLYLTIREFEKDFGILNTNYSLKDLEKVLNPVEFADFNSFLAYSICSIFYCYLKISGDFLNNHPIKTKLKNVQSLMKEIKEKIKNNSEEKRSLTINKEASKRIIDSCVSYNKDLKKRKY
ncbi:hypothetical protein MKS88_004623 [Plasmodium brasilianum]|uniref:Nuclear nucleic acid-binding protein C1D n=2 Tax=Plasmodium (Plasmodium) TaxID=418103 RepID=A0A1A8X0W1_PLAMA|nr:conserved Plasmodium protein, unknown function [Plasmodium malariae]KAI4836818.1 hypothetical protein MKS88_004623 [Plasmodium brasilianum]SBS98240.1 conserved Plasmodium protein, unknown function [Plasmodium malariae]SCO94117.1 conserved Plasmodium protein, unknown function [Plasmodium malariae]